MKRYTNITLLVTALIIGLLLLGTIGAVLADGPTGRNGTPRSFDGTMMGNQTDGDMYNSQNMPSQATAQSYQRPEARGRSSVWGYMQNAWGTMMRGWNGMFGGMMGSTTGNNTNMMGLAWFGGGMMGGSSWANNGTPISDERVQEIAQEYVASYGNPDLEVAEIMAFDNHFYVQAREKNTGRYAFEFLIDRYTGATHPEPGPNMMWNTKYGHMSGSGWGSMMGGMMGGYGGVSTGEATVTPEQAVEIAQKYLDSYQPRLEASDEADAFYGYYTLHILDKGEVVGMLSVNAYTGSVWPHTWHGTYLGMVGGDEH